MTGIDDDSDTASGTASDQLAVLGPLFVADVHDPVGRPAAPWRSMGELLTDPVVLEGRVAALRAFLAAGTGQAPEAVEQRVAASLAHLGLVSRLAAPVVALTLLGGQSRPVRLPELWWQPDVIGAAFPLSLPAILLTDDVAGGRGQPDPQRLAADLAEALFDTALADLSAAFSAFGVNAHIAWGNVASALHSAVDVIQRTTQRAHFHTADPQALLAAALGHRRLAGRATLHPDGSFRRRNCCLIYRAAPGRTGPFCQDCALSARDPA